MKKQSKRIASVALFSAILSVGAGVIPTINNVAYAQEVSERPTVSDEALRKAVKGGLSKLAEDGK